MRLILFALIFFACLSGVAPARTLGALRAGPTCVSWGTVVALRTSGTFVSSGLRFRFTAAVDTRAGRTQLRYAGGPDAPTGSEGYDGVTAWVQDSSRAWHALSSPHERALAISQAWIARRGWCANDFGGARVASGDSRREGARAFDVVRVTPTNGLPIEMWIDPRTQLVDRTSLQLAESREIDHYADWRTVAGIAFPFELRSEYPEDESTEIRTTRFAVPVPGLAAATFAPPPQPADVTFEDGSSSTTVPYWVEAQKPLVNVFLNGRGPFPFVLDTGGHFILTPQTARRIGVRGVGAGNELGQGTGIRKTSFARVATLRIGSAVVRDQFADIIPYSYRRLQRTPHAPKAGWLGLQFFERFRTTMNPQTRRLTITALARRSTVAPRNGVRIPLLFEEDAPVVACRIEGHPGTCMIDSGNAGPTIVEGHWLERAGLTARLHRGLEDDGDRIARARIDIGPLSLRRELVDFSPPALRGSESTQAVAAILSQNVLDRYVTTIDYGDGTMTLQPLGIAPAPFTRTGLSVEKRADGALRVSFVYPNSAAAEAGFRKGDRIEDIDGKSALRISSADLYDVAHGPAGARHHYTVVRGSKRFTIVLRLRDLL
jgi:hypothetical protein